MTKKELMVDVEELGDVLVNVKDIAKINVLRSLIAENKAARFNAQISVRIAEATENEKDAERAADSIAKTRAAISGLYEKLAEITEVEDGEKTPELADREKRDLLDQQITIMENTLYREKMVKYVANLMEEKGKADQAIKNAERVTENLAVMVKWRNEMKDSIAEKG